MGVKKGVGKKHIWEVEFVFFFSFFSFFQIILLVNKSYLICEHPNSTFYIKITFQHFFFSRPFNDLIIC